MKHYDRNLKFGVLYLRTECEVSSTVVACFSIIAFKFKTRILSWISFKLFVFIAVQFNQAGAASLVLLAAIFSVNDNISCTPPCSSTWFHQHMRLHFPFPKSSFPKYCDVITKKSKYVWSNPNNQNAPFCQNKNYFTKTPPLFYCQNGTFNISFYSNDDIMCDIS